MSANTVKARWVAGFNAVLPDGTPLVPGETVVSIGADEARDSDHWEPQVGVKPASTAPKASDGDGE